MLRQGVPALSVTVYGDWQTVISAREYRDVLLRQKPDNGDDAGFNAYRIPCDTTGDMVAAYMEFCVRLKMRCYFAMRFVSEDKAIRVDLESGDGFCSEVQDAPHGRVQVNAPVAEMEAAIKQAVDILQASVK